MDDDKVDLGITEMKTFLSTRLPPEGMSLDEKKRLAMRSEKSMCAEAYAKQFGKTQKTQRWRWRE